MPVYEYRCTACSSEFEYEHRMSERKTTCERCSGELERLISRTSFSFKGGGWYKDLYASSKPADAAAGGSGSGSGDKSSSSGDKGGGDKGGGSSGGDGAGPASSGSAPAASGTGGSSAASAAAS